MRIKILAISILLFVSCDNPIRFEVPQPEEKPNEKSIPKKLIGEYLSLSDSSVLTITKGLIIERKTSDFKSLLSELDSSDRIKIKHDTTFVDIQKNLKSEITVKGDSVFQHIDYQDTLFLNSRGDILRKFKGYYFINHQTSKNRWLVKKIARVKNGITIGTVSLKEDIEKLKVLTETKSDSIDNFRLTKKEFKKFLKENGFSDKEAFIKKNQNKNDNKN